MAVGLVHSLITDSLHHAAETLTLVAARWSRPSPSSTLLLGALAGFVFVVMSQLLSRSRRTARMCYWLGAALTTALLALGIAVSGRPPRQVVWAVALCVLLAVGVAYLAGWQLKIGGRTRSVFVANTYPDPPEDGSDRPPPLPPPNSYNGVVTADGFWWIAVVLTAMVSAEVYLFGWIWQSVLGAAFLTIVGAVAGLDDASRGHPAARGQKVQATITVVVSLHLWLLPVVAYAAGYQLGKRRSN